MIFSSSVVARPARRKVLMLICDDLLSAEMER